MSMDMENCFFSELPFGKIALQRFGEVPENFRLYEAGCLGNHPNYHGMEVKGAEFERMKRDKTRGKIIRDTTRTVYISKKDLQDFEKVNEQI